MEKSQNDLTTKKRLLLAKLKKYPQLSETEITVLNDLHLDERVGHLVVFGNDVEYAQNMERFKRYNRQVNDDWRVSF